MGDSSNGKHEQVGERRVLTGRAAGEDGVLLRWPELPGVELLRADFYRHAYVPHWHDALMVAASAHGFQRIRHKGVKRVLGPGSLTLLNPGELHDGEAEDPKIGWHHRVIFVAPSMLSLVGHERAGEIRFEHSVLEDARAAAVFLEMHGRLEGAATRLERESHFAEGMAHLLRFAGVTRMDATENKDCRRALGRARDFLHEAWAETVPLETLAGVAGLSPFHFLRMFRAQFGVPPHAYQMQLRVLRAKEMLFEGRAAKDVALEVGFYDQAHLTHVLRRYMGVTPGRVRQQGRVGE